MNADPGKLWQFRLQAIPYPYSKVFAGWVFKPVDVIQIVMIKLLVDRLENGFQFREIFDPARVWVDYSRNIDGDSKRVSMQPSAFMTLRHIRQSVC